MQQRKLFMGNVLHRWYWWDLCLPRTNMWRGWVLVLCGSILDMWLCLRWVAFEQSIVSPGQKVEKGIIEGIFFQSDFHIPQKLKHTVLDWQKQKTDLSYMGELSVCNSIYKINAKSIIIIICFCVSHCVKLMIKEPSMEQIVLKLARKNV